MANTLDYLSWRGDLNFAASPFSEIDSFIISQLSTPDYSGIVPSDGESVPLPEVVEKYFETHVDDVSTLGVLQSTYVLPMLRALPETPRFRDARLSFAVNRVRQENEEQFCAVTVELPDGSSCISFRGTDDTIIAWKEDFNLATRASVPAQKDAAEYVEKVASLRTGEIRICGHSKGGNLAVYSACSVNASLRNRISSTVSYDGPGFNASFLEGEGYLSMKDKITTVLSQNSLVGTLLETAGEPLIVKSDKAGPMAHDGFSWQVLGNSFVREPALSETSIFFKRVMAETLGSLETEEKQAFVDELFDTLLSTGAVTITDLTNFTPQQVLEMVKNLHDGKKIKSFGRAVAEHMLKDTAEKIKVPEIKLPEIKLPLR